MTINHDQLIAQVDYREQIGVSCGPTAREVTTILEVYPTNGEAFYLCGVRTLNDNADDVRLTFLHPRTGKPLFGREEIQASELSVPDEETFPPLVRFSEDHAEDDIEPVYCSMAEPLLIRVSCAAVSMGLVLFGSRDYQVLGRGETVSLLRGPFKYAFSSPDPMPLTGHGLGRDHITIGECESCSRKTVVLQVDGSGGEYNPRSLCRACVLAPFAKYDVYRDTKLRDGARDNADEDDED